MLSHILKQAFDPYFPAPLEAWRAFEQVAEPVFFRKDAVIKDQDQAEKYFYFILSGSAGIMLWNGTHFVCLDFAFDHQFCCDYMSLLLRKPTPLQLIALEDSHMVRITRDDFYQLGKTPVGQIIMQISAESSFIEKQQQQIELLTQSAATRYHQLLQKFPNIQNRVAQKHLASYLGITPQSLSRIRKKQA